MDKAPNVEDADDDKYRKVGSVRRLFEEFNRDYYKPKVIDRGFAEEVNNYIKYMSEGHEDEKSSHKEYLNIIRPYLRDLINTHKPIERLNNNTDTDTDNIDNNSNNTDNNNNNNNNNDNNTERREWKIMLKMYINSISTKSFNKTRTMHPKSKQVELYMGSDTENKTDTLFNALLQNFQSIQETSNERGKEFIPDRVALLEYAFCKIDITKAKSYIITPD